MCSFPALDLAAVRNDLTIRPEGPCARAGIHREPTDNRRESIDDHAEKVHPVLMRPLPQRATVETCVQMRCREDHRPNTEVPHDHERENLKWLAPVVATFVPS